MGAVQYTAGLLLPNSLRVNRQLNFKNLAGWKEERGLKSVKNILGETGAMVCGLAWFEVWFLLSSLPALAAWKSHRFPYWSPML